MDGEDKKEPWGFCETPQEGCTMNYCDDNGCLNRKRCLVDEDIDDVNPSSNSVSG